MAKAWLIGDPSGDPFKNYEVTTGTATLTAASAYTIAVEGSILSALGVGTTSTSLIRCVSTSNQRAGGTAIFNGDTASECFDYQIIHKGLK